MERRSKVSGRNGGEMTRGEIADRFRRIAAVANIGVNAAREGRTKECKAVLRDLQDMLNVFPDLDAKEPYPELPQLRPPGSVGYNLPPSRPTAAPRPAPPSNSLDSVWNPLNDVIDELKIAQASRMRNPASKSNFGSDTVYFDLKRIPGTEEFVAAFATAAPLTTDEIKLATTFKRLPQETRERIVREFRRNGKPVACRLRKGA